MPLSKADFATKANAGEFDDEPWYKKLIRVATSPIPAVDDKAQVLATNVEGQYRPPQAEKGIMDIPAGLEAIPDILRNLMNPDARAATLRGGAAGMIEGAGKQVTPVNIATVAAGPAGRLVKRGVEAVRGAGALTEDAAMATKLAEFSGKGPTGLPKAAQELANPGAQRYMETQAAKNQPIARAIHGAKSGGETQLDQLARIKKAYGGSSIMDTVVPEDFRVVDTAPTPKPSAPDEMMTLEHRSPKSDLTELDPKKYGTGSAGAEKARMGEPGWIDRVYTTIQGRPVEGRFQKMPTYLAQVLKKHVYPLAEDPLKLKTIAQRLSENDMDSRSVMENLVLKNGFKGYTDGTAVVWFGKLPVELQK